ncbi:VOC family protein [Halohasta litorea]|uniref:VOC family protein n=1 Tax=Halohasta litorea TaxID=869891 RepID=A0ABD6D9I3_9EURY|nr:VOC family protein [Halohasta litorea]
MPDLQTHHVGVTVSDLDRAIDFYRDILGLSVVARFEVAGEAFETGVGIEGASAHFAHLDGGSARIELVEYEPPAEGLPTPQLNDAGATHLGLEVADLDAFYNELPSSVDTLSPPQTTETGTRILFLRDPEENLIEILELGAE